MIFNELHLLEWKRDFFRKEFKNLEEYLNEESKFSIGNFVEKKTEDCSLDQSFMNDLLSRYPEVKIINAFYYVFSRRVDFKWGGLFSFIEKNYAVKDKKFSKDFIYDKNSISTYNTIRQCRPDKKEYTYDAMVNVGFYNKNKNFIYKCYNDDMALSYLGKEFGQKMQDLYKSLPVSQARSDFFLVASLYKEGGISADVCSVALSNISSLIQNHGTLLVYDGIGINKKFLFSNPENYLFKSYLNELIEKINYMGNEFHYELFSSRHSLHDFIMDFYAHNLEFFDNEGISFISDDIFKAYIIDAMSEENLSEDDNLDKINFKALSKESFYKNDSIFFENTIVSNEYFSPKKDNVVVIGHDLNPQLSNQSQTAYSIPSIDVVRMNNICLSGHACLWSEGRFITFDSYLSFVAESEYRAGHWRKPNAENITRVIEDDVIVAFSAGYGCYGHYIVDDLPRIGAIKKHLGSEFHDKKFIIPAKTPQWGIELLEHFFEISKDSIIFFDHENDLFHLNSVILSSYPSREYKFHRFIKEFYDGIPKNINGGKPSRRICLSRKLWEERKVNQRIFLQQDLFEEMAVARGFEIIRPEKLSISEQIDLMANTACQVGEHGSAQHASVFNPFGMIVGTLNPLTEVQVNLGRIYNDKNFLCYADGVDRDDRNNYYYSISEEKLRVFFDEIEKYEENNFNLIAPKELFS